MTTGRSFRIGRLLAVCLITGAVIQAALAWTILLVSQGGVPRTTTMTAAEIAKPLDVPAIVRPDRSTFGPPIWESDQRRGIGWLVDVSRERVLTSSGRRCWGQSAWVYCGWPEPSFDLHLNRIADDGSWPDWKRDPAVAQGWCPMDAPTTPAGLTIDLFPSHPIWRGTLINAGVFGAVVWLSILAVRLSARQFRADRGTARAQEGLCVACAYPLHELSICPECGLSREKPCPEQPTSDGSFPPAPPPA